MEAAALRMATLAREAIDACGRFTWALSGGSTPRQLYALLASDRFVSEIEWSRVYFFWGDERCVPPNHEESNYRMVREALLDVIRPQADQVFRMRGEDDPDEAARAYEATLRTFFGDTVAAPSFDLVLLGMGADGHTASLFPGTGALEETKRWVVPNRVSRTGPARLTMTLSVINAAHQILFLVSGSDKAERLKQVLEDPNARLPAQRVRPTHGELEWMIDAEAGGRRA
jgi:6-phosphogluconolactonase